MTNKEVTNKIFHIYSDIHIHKYMEHILYNKFYSGIFINQSQKINRFKFILTFPMSNYLNRYHS